MATNKQKNQKVADNDAAALGYLRKGEHYHQAEIQMLIAIAEANGLKVTYRDKYDEVTIEKAEPVEEVTQPQTKSFIQMQGEASPSSAQPTIDYVKLADSLSEPVSKALQNAVETSPVHVQVVFDSSAHMVNNQTAMTLAREEWSKWVKDVGSKTLSGLANAPAVVTLPRGQAITFGSGTVHKVPEDELDAIPKRSSKTAEEPPMKHPRLHQLWHHVWSDIVTSWWKCFAYTVALCCLVLAIVSWYRQWRLEAVVKEYYIIKPILKQDQKYAPLIHTMDSVILKDGIDEVCERVYGEKR